VLIEALAGGDDPNDLFSEMGRRPQNAPLSERRAKIDRIFGTTSVEDILTLLERDDNDWSRETAAVMRSRSPTSLRIAYEQIRNGRQLSFDDCMKMEFRIAHRILTSHDFIEGVRAVIVDKDNAAKWRPATLGDVADADVQAYFAPVEQELPLQD
jgi:enoyl-CoA hydratase